MPGSLASRRVTDVILRGIWEFVNVLIAAPPKIPRSALRDARRADRAVHERFGPWLWVRAAPHNVEMASNP